MMMRKINYSLIGDKIKNIDTNYYYSYITSKVKSYNNTITELKLKLELNNLYFGKWMFL